MSDEEYEKIMKMIDSIPHYILADLFWLLKGAFKNVARLERDRNGWFSYWDAEQIIEWMTTWVNPENNMYTEDTLPAYLAAHPGVTVPYE